MAEYTPEPMLSAGATLHINIGEWARITDLHERTGGAGPAWESGLREILGEEIAARCLSEDPMVKVHPATIGSDGRLYDADDRSIDRFTIDRVPVPPET